MALLPSPMQPPALVGRDRELALLRERLDAALTGHGSLVLIGGEAGIGKTAVADTICWEATRQDALVLVGRCYDLSETPPYGPWVELFARYHAADGDPSLPAAFARRGTVGDVMSQGTLFQQVLDFLAALSLRHPLVVLLDDAHWMDTASLDLLRVLARSLASHPIMLLVTYRVDELTRRHPLSQRLPLLVREASATRLSLHPLATEDAAALVRARFALPDADATRLVTYLDERAEGNPFFLSELLQTLEEEGVLRRREGSWALGELNGVQVPPLLRQVIDRRFARLDADAQVLLAAAAVIGQDVPLDIWIALTDANEEIMGATIEQGIEGHMIETLPDGAGVRFVHALIREALYEGIAPLRRRAWHRRIGDILIALPGTDPDAVAYHFRQAGDARVAAWLIRAGERAHRAFAWQTASDRYEAALALKEGNGADLQARGWLLYQLADVNKFVNAPRAITYLEEAARLGVAAGDAALVANVRFMLGLNRADVRQGLVEMEAAVAALWALSADDRARMKEMEIIEGLDAEYAHGRLLTSLAGSGRYVRMFEQAERILPGLLDRADTGDPVRPALAWTYRGLAYAYAALGQPSEARRAFRHARAALLARGNYLETGLNALNDLRYVLLPYYTDDVAERERVAAEAERWYVRADDLNLRIPTQRGSLPLMMVDGRWSEARSVAHSVLAVGGRGAYLGNAQSVMCQLAYAQGDVALATTLISAVLPERPPTDPETAAYAFREHLTLFRVAAAVATDAGNLAEARVWLEAHDRWLAWSGSVLGQAEGALSWSAYYRAAGDWTRAEAHGRRALAYATTPRQPLALIAAHRLGGELATEVGRFADAVAHLDTALALADACQAPYERTLTLLARATLLAATDAAPTALPLIEEARGIGVALDARPAIARADALIARIDAMTQPSPAYPAGLSAREVEVLRLLAAGRTNQDIADALFLSVHTVRAHLRTILTKTDTDNRAAAVAFAFQYGII